MTGKCKLRFGVVFIAAIAVFSVFIAAEKRFQITVRTADFLGIRQEETLAGEEAATVFADINEYDLSQYPASLVRLLERNPEAEDFVLSYPDEHDAEYIIELDEYKNSEEVPLFMQWDKRWGYMTYGDDLAGLNACGPMCLSMAAFYLTNDEAMAPDKIIEFAVDGGYCVYGNGSKWTLISQGGEELGLNVTEIPRAKQRVMDNLRIGNPIICVMGPGDFTTTGHFIVLAGIEDGLIKVNDPNSYKNSEKLWSYEEIEDQIENLWVIRG